MPLVEVGLPELQFYRRQLALKHWHEEVAAAAGGFKKTGVDPFCLTLNKVQHRLHYPGGREYFAMIGNALF